MAAKCSVIAPEPSDGLEATCWISLGDTTNVASGSMIQPCLCPRYAHQKCLARWQLQNAGKTYALSTPSSLPRRPRYDGRQPHVSAMVALHETGKDSLDFSRACGRVLDLPAATLGGPRMMASGLRKHQGLAQAPIDRSVRGDTEKMMLSTTGYQWTES